MGILYSIFGLNKKNGLMQLCAYGPMQYHSCCYEGNFNMNVLIDISNEKKRQHRQRQRLRKTYKKKLKELEKELIQYYWNPKRFELFKWELELD